MEKVRCFYITIVLDRINNTIVASPQIIESFVIDEKDGRCVVQSSITNAHLRTIKREWVFVNECAAKEYVKNHKEELDNLCEDARWWFENYMKRNKNGNS